MGSRSPPCLMFQFHQCYEMAHDWSSLWNVKHAQTLIQEVNFFQFVISFRMTGDQINSAKLVSRAKMNLNSQCISEIFIAKDWWLHNSNLLAVIVQRTFYRSIAYLDVFESWHCQLLHHQDSLKDNEWFLKCLCRKIGDHGEVPTTHRTMKFSMIHLQTATTHLVQFCLDAPSRLKVVRQQRILFKGPCSPDHSRPRFMPFWSSWWDKWAATIQIHRMDKIYPHAINLFRACQ